MASLPMRNFGFFGKSTEEPVAPAVTEAAKTVASEVDSVKKTAGDSESIFASADYFKDVAPDQVSADAASLTEAAEKAAEKLTYNVD